MNKWNTLRVAMYGACLGLLYAAFLEIGLWAQVDMYGQAGGGLIGGTIVGRHHRLTYFGFSESLCSVF
jgi:hypothetical protein